MKYDFDTIIDRGNKSNSYSYKWDIKKGELPMWVADMDFATAPEIVEAFAERIKHPVFGYSIVPDEWYKSYISWWKKRHNFTIKKDWLMFVTGVVPAISSIVRKVTTPAENVCVITPAYNIFFNSIYNNGRNILESQLKYENNEYSIDFEDLENKLSNPQTTLLILCNPHNPVGKIWSAKELAKIGKLCDKYNVKVISDEIHCDIVKPGCEYVPFASVNEVNARISMTCIAPTKAFNIAGLQSAAIVVPDKELRHKVNRGINTDEVAEPNSFAITAPIAAFNKGGAWLDELNEYIQKNRERVEEFFEGNANISVVKSKATYLLWLDCTKITDNSVELADFIREKTGLYLSEGAEYRGNGNEFLRLNIACPRTVLEEGLKRLEKGLKLWAKTI